MACGDYSTLADYWLNGQFFDAIYCPYGSQIGWLVFPLLVFMGLAIAITVYTRSVIVPMVMTILFGALIIPQLPTIAMQFAAIIVVLGITAGGYWVWHRAQGGL